MIGWLEIFLSKTGGCTQMVFHESNYIRKSAVLWIISALRVYNIYLKDTFLEIINLGFKSDLYESKKSSYPCFLCCNGYLL